MVQFLLTLSCLKEHPSAAKAGFIRWCLRHATHYVGAPSRALPKLVVNNCAGPDTRANSLPAAALETRLLN